MGEVYKLRWEAVVASWDDAVGRVAPRELIQHDAGTLIGNGVRLAGAGTISVMMAASSVFGSWGGEAVHET